MQRRTRTSRAGFTMLEMLITIGIIVVLAGLTLTVISSMSRKSEVRQAENTLQILETALREWELAADRQLRVATPFDSALAHDVFFELNWGQFNPTDLEEVSIEALHEVLSILDRSGNSKQIISNLDEAFLIANDPDDADEGHALALEDPWENDYIVVFAGPKWNQFDYPTFVADEDGTIRTEFEERFGICVNGRPLFISSGPDGAFGDFSAAVDSLDYKKAADNVHSGRFDQPETQP